MVFPLRLFEVCTTTSGIPFLVTSATKSYIPCLPGVSPVTIEDHAGAESGAVIKVY